jgi:hypothetical protein
MTTFHSASSRRLPPAGRSSVSHGMIKGDAAIWALPFAAQSTVMTVSFTATRRTTPGRTASVGVVRSSCTRPNTAAQITSAPRR